ncbi:hypothetical protein KP509_39G045100 [Ceratopteris richardii]|uniref:Major facilitator superfamily (MFS) profile domain-containing protein n=2 Tax=Ceratopteris richardii TaxID=49495 RepID=A0A8T2Q0U6_CERRI|nr:hypothetical protein KP509_39G045100 [Ceratopteris richardii]
MALTVALVNLASIMERADEALLPGAYREVGLALHASPARLGSLTLLRSLVQALCFPIAAYAAQFHDRAAVICVGALTWSIATLLVGVSTTFLQVAFSRALNGIGLAVVVPAIQSIIADCTSDHNRGGAFGWLQLTGNVGSIVGGLCAVLMANELFFGIAGWRVAFFLVAFVSTLVGILVYIFAVDPRSPHPHNRIGSEGGLNLICSSTKEMLMEAKTVLKIRTFQVIVAQGIAGTFPWAALTFAPMWLEGIGFSNDITALLMGIFILAGSLGGLFGGYMGDLLSKRLPNSGRIMLSQISSGLAVPLAAILLLCLPVNPAEPLLHGVVLFVVGFSISWNAPATNNPIFAEIVPEISRATVYALDRSFESVLASFAPPVVGLLAQGVYGYVPFPEGTDQHLADRRNSRALAEALYVSIGVPMAICCSVYTLLYWTYPQDRDKALKGMYMSVGQELPASVQLTGFFQHSPEENQTRSHEEDSHLLLSES